MSWGHAWGLLASTRNMHAGNKFFQDHKPWEALKADKELCGSYLAACMGLVALLAALVKPYMPSITIKVVISSTPFGSMYGAGLGVSV